MSNQFHEKQRFNQIWMVLLAFLVTGIMAYALIQQLVFKIPFGSNPASDGGLILIAALVFAFFAFLQFLRLDTQVDQTGIHIHFFPFVKRTFDWDTIEHAEVIEYGFVGGWGIRLWTRYGTVYNVKGKKGLFLQLTNGKKVLIGTQKAEELKNLLKDLLN